MGELTLSGALETKEKGVSLMDLGDVRCISENFYAMVRGQSAHDISLRTLGTLRPGNSMR